MKNYIKLLRQHPSYLRLWIAQAISLLGDWFTAIALSTLVSRYTNGSGLAISGLILARFVPPLFVGPLAGVVVDRLNRKRLLMLSDIVRGFTVLVFLLVRGPEWLWLIYLLTMLQFSLSALFEPCRQAIIPSLVDADELVEANALGSTTWSVMLAFGAVVGGAVAALIGTQLSLVIDSMTFFASAALISSIVIHHSPINESQTAQTAAEPINFVRIIKRGLHGFQEGLRYIAEHPTTAAILLVKLGGNVGNTDLLMVIYATQLFVIGQNGTGSLGLLYGGFGIGAVLGPVVLSALNNNSISRMRRLIAVGYLLIAIGWVLFGAAPTLLLAVLALVVKAMGTSIYWTYSSAIIQKTVPNNFLGRIFSIDQLGFQLGTTISAVATGWIVDRLGTLRGINLTAAIQTLHTGMFSVQASASDVRVVVYGTAILSIIPLVLWVLALPSIERHQEPEIQ